MLSLGGEQTSEWVLDSPANEEQAQLSPDTNWIAFTSDESGAPEVYVWDARGSGAKRRVSTRGGAQAHWRGDGKELFYLAPDGNLMAVEVTASRKLDRDRHPARAVRHRHHGIVRRSLQSVRRHA